MTRRAVLGVVGSAVAGALTATVSACSDAARPGPSSSSPPAPSPTADDLALARARADAARLADTATELVAVRPDLAGLLTTIAADHRAHLAALGTPANAASVPAAPVSPPTASAAPPTPSVPRPTASAPRPGASASRPGAPRARVQSLLDDEVAAAQTALDDVPLVSPGPAVLLARIAASRMVHADLIAAKSGLRPPGVLSMARPPASSVEAPSSGSPTGSAIVPAPAPASNSGPTAAPSLAEAGADALAALTSGEHAAVYAYGIVVARVARPDRDRARQAWAWHTARRDLLEERLLAAGVRPPAAAPGYEVGPLASPAAAVVLAATVEGRIAALLARAVGTTAADDRTDAAQALAAVARRAAAWRGQGEALPG